MGSFSWQIISEIFLGIGIVLLISALVLTVRYRVISNMISDIRVRKMSPEPFRAAPSMTIDLKSAETGASQQPAGDEEGPWTVVVASKQEETGDGTVVVGKKESPVSEFNITSNIIVINADVDVIDNGRRK